MADFYNLADQKLFKDYQFLPQEKYRLGLNLPTDATEDEVVTNQGIVNTNAFANSGGGGGDFNPAGNMFGEGTAVSPVYGNTYIDTVRREGPDSRQAVEALINAGGSAPGGLMPQEYGFQFTGIPTKRGDVLNEFDSINYNQTPAGGSYTDDMDYSKSAFDSLESEDEKIGFLSKMFNKAGQIKSSLPSWAQAGITALNPFSIIPSLLSGIGGDGPKYGIAGLTDQQKSMYDNLSSQGMLFNDQGIFKTLTGKNLMGKGYLEGQQDIYNDLKDKGYDVDDDGNITLDGKLVDLTNKNYFKNKVKEAFTAGKGETIKDTTLTPELINEFLENNNTPVDTPVNQNNSPGYPGNPNNNNNNNNDGGSNDNTGGDPGSEGAGDRFENRSGRGRTGYFYGGKV
jgi:hypothetical protein